MINHNLVEYKSFIPYLERSEEKTDEGVSRVAESILAHPHLSKEKHFEVIEEKKENKPFDLKRLEDPEETEFREKWIKSTPEEQNIPFLLAILLTLPIPDFERGHLLDLYLSKNKKRIIPLVQEIQREIFTYDYQRYHIALYLIRHDADCVTEHLHKFSLNMTELNQLAKYCALKFPESFIKNARYFNLEKSAFLLILSSCGPSIIPHLVGSHLELDDYFPLIQSWILKNPGVFAFYVHLIPLHEQARFFAARECALKAPLKTLKYIENFHLNSNQKLYIAKLLAKNEPEFFVQYQENFNFNCEQIFVSLCHVAWTDFSFTPSYLRQDTPFDLKEAEEVLSKVIDNHSSPRLQTYLKDALKKILKNSTNTPNELYLKEVGLKWMGQILFLLFVSPLSEEAEIRLIKEDLIGALMTLRAPVARDLLSVYALISLKENASITDSTSRLYHSPKYRFPSLLRYLIPHFKLQGVNPKVCDQFLIFLEKLKKNNKILFWDSVHFKLLIKTLHLLSNEDHLTPLEKEKLLIYLNESFSSKNEESKTFLNKLSSLSMILEFKGIQELKLKLENHPYILSSLAENLFMQRIPLENVDHLLKKFEETFGACRNPKALLNYTANLYSFGEIAPLQALGLYVSAVLKGPEFFKKLRHSTENNPHLKTLYEKFPDLEYQWTVPFVYPQNSNPLLFKEVDFNKVTVMTSENPYDLLLSGEEVRSCLGVKEAIIYSKCLLAYLIDGKNQFLIIQNKETQKIEARVVLRLLYDGENPVLLLEEFYPLTISKEYKEALLDLAHQKAEQMNLPLLQVRGSGRPYKQTIYSLGSSAPYEYFDSSSGPIDDGITEITRSYHVNRLF